MRKKLTCCCACTAAAAAAANADAMPGIRCSCELATGVAAVWNAPDAEGIRAAVAANIGDTLLLPAVPLLETPGAGVELQEMPMFDQAVKIKNNFISIFFISFSPFA